MCLFSEDEATSSWSIPDLAEFVDDHRRPVHPGVAQQALQQRRLAAAENIR